MNSFALTIRELKNQGRDRVILATQDPAIIAAVRRAIERRLAPSRHEPLTAKKSDGVAE